jgi:hypothetical protein
MQFLSKPSVAGLMTGVALMIGVALTPADVGAQTVLPGNAGEGADTATLPSGAGQRTGKERLGEKWSDEQRFDNCKVPLDKRGTRQRPDSCVHAPTE